jgi:hypothetical protein
MKYTVANDDLKLKNKNGLYCFLPYENLDKKGKAIFKIGMTTQDFANRIENYHSYYPMGVYMVFFLSFSKKRVSTDVDKKKEQLKLEKSRFESIEKELFELVVKNEGKRIKFPSRPSQSWMFPSEWFYTDIQTLQTSFEEIQKIHGGKLLSFHLDDIANNFKNNKKDKRDKYLAEIVYYV